MSNEIFRRQFLKAGVGFITGTGSAILFGDFTTVLAQSTGQRDWRFCHKCQAMFFDGFPTKGSCAAGGTHEAMGYNFVLPHDVAETPTAQQNWRFCHKCQAMFFDGFPAKGTCAAGGAHEAAGYNFVLPHETDYPSKVSNLLLQSHSMQDVTNMVWNEAGRGIASEKIRQSINGREFVDGVSGYDANVNMGNITATWNEVAPNQLSMEVQIPGNNVEFHTTTPTIFGSWGDPAFRVGFDIIVNLAMSISNSSTPITISQMNAQITNASIHGSNAVGTLIETLADFFTGGEFSRSITDSINNDHDLKGKVAQAIASALDRVW